MLFYVYFQSYDKLADESYTHFRVNHLVSFKDAESGQHTNSIEGLWRHLKESLPAFNRRKVFFNGYIQKFIFLRWCKERNKTPFVEFVKYAGMLYDPTKGEDGAAIQTLIGETAIDLTMIDGDCDLEEEDPLI